MPLLILFAVVYGLVLFATPILAISLYVRNARLRKQLNDLVEENAKQFTQLQRAVGELQTKIAATVPPTAPPPFPNPRPPRPPATPAAPPPPARRTARAQAINARTASSPSRGQADS